jgi:hypothetical protein
MKRDISKHGHRERVDKVEKKAVHTGTIKKDKISKRRLSIYDEFSEDDTDDFDPKSIKNTRFKR